MTLREQTGHPPLRGIIEQMLESSGLLQHYRTEKGRRIENLQELVNAAESFVTQEGFGRDAVACRQTSMASRSRKARPARGWTWTRHRPMHHCSPAGLPASSTPTRAKPSRPGGLPHPRRARGGRQPAQAGQDAVQLMTVHASKGWSLTACSSAGWKRACSRTTTPPATATAWKKSAA